MMKRRQQQWATIKLLMKLWRNWAEEKEILKALLQLFLSDLEVLHVPALQKTIRGNSEVVEFVIHHLGYGGELIDGKIVDVTREDSQGSLISVRMLCRGKQVKRVFPHLPVNEVVDIAIKISFVFNDGWRPKESSWEFIPLQPLLDIASMQDLCESDAGQSGRTSESAASTPRPSTPDSSADSSEIQTISSSDLQSHVEEKEMRHRLGTCTPCNFHAFKKDGCRLGDACPFCHLCTASEAKARKKIMKQEAIARNEAMMAEEEPSS
jgi:hypothetical protein